MTASLTPRKVSSAAASPRQFSVAPSVKVMEGCLGGRYPSGTNQGCVAEMGADPTLICEGIFRHTVDNTALAAPGPDVYVDDDLIWPLFSTGLDPSMEGQPAYGVDNQTFSTTSNGGTYPAIGEIWEVTSTTTAFVRVGKRAVAAVAGAAALAAAAVAAVALTDAPATIQITAGKWRSLPAATLTANRTLTLGTTGAKAGDRIKITRADLTGYTYAIVNGGVGAGTLATFPGGEVGGIEAAFDGTNWALYDAGAIVDEIVIGAALTNADATIQRGGRRSERVLPAATLTAAHTLTLGTTGAQTGDRMRVLRKDVTGFAYTIVDGGSGTPTLAVMAGGEQSFLEAYFDGTNWQVEMLGQFLADWVTGTALTDTATTTIQRGGRRTSFLLAGTMSQDETITVGTTGAQGGDIIRVLRTSTSAHTATFTNGGGGGGNPFVMPNSKVNFVELRYDGTNWLFFGGGTQ